MSSVLKSFAKTLNDLAEKNEDVRNSLSELKQNNAEVLRHLSQHTTQIAALETENAKLFKQVKFLTEQVIQQDQYSRKDIVIMTGLTYEEGESQEELATSVTRILNQSTGNSLNLTKRDFIAIHRNRINLNSDRPPTVTIKFLRFTDKDAMFTKMAFAKRKAIYPYIKLHHGLCPGLIEERNKISNHENVKFCRYEGANIFFTVCVVFSGKLDRFYNRIRNYEHLHTGPYPGGLQQVQLHPQDESRVHFAKPVFRRVQQGATGASAKLRLGLLKSLSKIDCGPKGLENARFYWGFGPWDTRWGVAPGPPLGDGALRLASLGQLHPPR
jgi:hypothetical protein